MDSSAYLSQLIGLLPPGDALAREPGSRLERLLSVPAAELARVDGRVEALLTESDPARTTEMLADWERALGLPDICYPNFQFSRASRARYFDGAGVLREAAVDEPRYLYDALGQRTEAVLVEAAATNYVTQPYYQVGASGQWFLLGSGFSATPNYALAPDGRLTAARVQVAAAVAAWLLRFNTSGLPINTQCVASFYVYARSLGNLSSAVVDLNDTAGVNVVGQVAVGEWRRVVVSGLSSGTIPTKQWLDLQFAQLTTGAVDIDIWGVQLEAGDVASSLILPVAPGTLGPTTRAADQLYIATTQERRQRILARLIERFEPTPAAIIGLATRLGSAVTLSEFRPHDCEDDCEAPVLDDAWAHAFQVAGGAQQVAELTCEDTCETPLSQWRTGAYECAIRRFAPAHTVPIFSYGAPPPPPPPVPSIITSGLVMHLDAGDAASYPGSGTAWTDLSGAGNNGTLTNGPTYSAANGGQIIFDGSNDFVGAGNAAGLQLSVFTLEIWFKANNTNSNYRGLLVKELAWGLYLFNNTLGSYDPHLETFYATEIYAGDNTWRQAVVTIAADGGATIYVNGSLVLTASGSVSSQANPVTVGSGVGLQFMSGSVAIARIYNRALSAPEIIQNFDVNRGRFGL
jgi:uncharacterized protein YmfQ (DUF2313 family)